MKIDLRSTRIWTERYDKEEKDGKAFEFLVETLESDISGMFFSKTQMDYCIFDVMSKLQTEKEFDKLLELYKHSEKHKEKFAKGYFLGYYCIDYYLFKGEIQGIERHLNDFLNDPVKSIDFFVPIYDKIVYYGYRELSIKICHEIIDKVKDAPGLIPGAEEDFTKTVVADKLHDVYCDMKNHVQVNKKDIIEYLTKYDYIMVETDIDMMQSLWTADDPEFPDFQEYIEDGSFFEWKLMLLFMDYMAGKNITFATAYDIWNITTQCFKTTMFNRKKVKSFESMFKLDEDKYKKEIYWRIDPIFSNKVTYAYAAAWGMQYLVDFLHKYGYISKKTHDKNSDVIDSLKVDIIKGDPNILWQYKFLCKWAKPDGTTEEQFEITGDLCEESFTEHFELFEGDAFFEDFADEE